ncbi:MAG: alpha/beta hydrolase, partial [Myxococcota bacterium]
MSQGGSPTLGGGQWWTDRRYAAGYRLQTHARSGQHRVLDERDRQVCVGELDACVEAMPAWEPPSELVVLLHGLGRRRQSLLPLSRALEAGGHHTLVLDYASTRAPIESHVASLREVLANLPRAVETVCFVTHSLGGIIARHALSQGWHGPSPRLLAMLAPPSTSAMLATRLDSPPFRFVMGPSGAELAAGAEAPTPSITLKIVSGGQRGWRGLNPRLPGDHPGGVAVVVT